MLQFTTNLKLGQPQSADRGWGANVNTYVTTTLDALAPIASGNVTLREIPSTSLYVYVAPAQVQKSDGTIGSFAGGTQVLGASVTSYLYLDTTPTLQVSAVSWPTAPHTRLAVAVTNGTVVTLITDARVVLEPSYSPHLLLAGGTLADGANIAVGSTTGTKIATAATQKLGFMGKSPVVQQTGGAATASSSYTSVEQGMVQKAYDCLRAFGFLS